MASVEWTFAANSQTSTFEILAEEVNGVPVATQPEQQPIVILEGYAGGGGGTVDYVADEPFVWEVPVATETSDAGILRAQAGYQGTLTDPDSNTYTLTLTQISLATIKCGGDLSHIGSLRFEGFN